MTIQDIEQQILDASFSSDLNTLNSIILSLTPNEIAQIDSNIYGQVLQSITYFPFLSHDNVSETMHIIMETASPYISSHAIGQALFDLATQSNLGGIDAIVHNLSESHLQPVYQGGLDSHTVSNALNMLVGSMNWAVQLDDNTAHNTAIRDFMEVLSDHVDSQTIGQALVDLAYQDNLDGIDAILDNLSEAHLQSEYFGGISNFAASNTLSIMVQSMGWYPMADNTAHNTAIRDFMEVLSDHVDSQTIGQALVDLAYQDNLEGIDAILDNLSEAHLQSEYFGGISNFAASNTLSIMVQSMGWYPMADNTAHNTAIRDFMEVLSDHVDSQTIGQALVDLAYQDNLDGIDAILDNLSEAHLQSEYFGGISNFAASNTLSIMVQSMGWYPMADNTAHNTAIRDFMEVLSDHVDSQTIGQALVDLAYQDNLDGIDAIIDNLSEAHLQSEYFGGISNFAASNTLSIMVQSMGWYPMADNTAHNTAIRDFMEVLSDHVDSQTIGQALVDLAYQDNLDGIDAIIDNLSEAHLQSEYFGGISNFAASNTLSIMVQSMGWYPMADNTAHNTAIRDFMEVLSDHVDSQTIGQALVDLAYQDNLDGIDAIIDNLSEAHLQSEYFGGISNFAASNTLSIMVQSMGWYPMADNTAHNTAIRDFMEVLSDHVDSQTIGQALVDLAYQDNLDGIDAIIDNLSEAHLQSEYFGGISNFAASNTLSIMVQSMGWYPMADNTAHNTAIRDFMEVLSDHVDSQTIGQALVDLAYQDNLDGIDAIIDNLSEAHLQSEYFGGLNSNDVSNTLNVMVLNARYSQDLAESNAAIRGFMEILSDQVPLEAVRQALSELSRFDNLEGIDAIVDNISDVQLSLNGNGVHTFDVSETLNNMVTNAGQTQDPASHNTAIRDFMEVLGDYVFPSTVSVALLDMSNTNNLDGIDAIIDNLSDAHLSNMNSYDVSNALVNMASNGWQDQAKTADAIDEFMEVLSSSVSSESINSSLKTFGWFSNYDGVEAIIGNLTPDQINSIEAYNIQALQANSIKLGTASNDFIWDYYADNASLHGMDGNDTLYGGRSDTHLFGGDGDDTLFDFYGGNDTIYGGDGNDTMYGGSGADTFTFRQGDEGVDFIYYVRPQEGDRLDISDFLEQYDPTQNAIDDFVKLSDDGRSTTVSVDVDGQGSGEAVEIALLYGTTGMSVEDLIGTDETII